MSIKQLQYFLKNYNIKHVFGYSGGANLPILNNIKKSKHTTFIANRNEQCAGHAATGYSNFDGIGVTITTSGPGVTNMITPLHDAYSDGIPLIAITGQVPTSSIGTDAFQECNAIELTKPCVKWNYQLNKYDNIYDVLKYAYEISISPRKGPVHIDIPKDIGMSEIIPNNSCELYDQMEYKTIEKDDTSYINYDNLLDLIMTAKKPVIIAGKGCIDNSSRKLLQKISMTLNIPIATTLHGLGVVDETEYYSLGMVGMHGSVTANYAVQNSDLIIGLGYRYDDRTTGNVDKYALDAKKIHIDNSEKQIKLVQNTLKNHDLISIQKDTNNVLEELVNIFDKFDENVIYNSFQKRTYWSEQIDIWKYYNPYMYHDDINRLPKIQYVLQKLDNYLECNDCHKSVLFTTGVGNHQMMTAQYITWKYPSLLTSGSLGVMGVGLPYAIGAQLANPDKQVIVIDGDGSFNMTHVDLMTVKEQNLPIKIFIMNDCRLQMVHTWQKLFFNENYIATEHENPDYSMLAEAHGIKSFVCDKREDVTKTIKSSLIYPGACVVEFKVDPDICLPLVPPGNTIDDMMLFGDNQIIENQSLPPS
jgi:acetolactate synthase I/II/III large subunit